MSRYIDADALKQKWIFRGQDGKAYQYVIDSMPTADVVDVVHGEWKWTGSNNLRCSECGDIAPTSYNYCPNCGARMDGAV